MIKTKTNEKKVDYTKMSNEELRTHFGNWSKAMRGLNAAGFSRGEIAKLLNKRYQHVRNVLVTPVASS